MQNPAKEVVALDSGRFYGHMIQGVARAKGNPVPEIFGFALCYGNYDQEGGFNKNSIEFLTITGPEALAEVLPEPTRKRIREILSISGNDEMPNPTANYQNCRFCKWKMGCEHAVLENIGKRLLMLVIYFRRNNEYIYS